MFTGIVEELGTVQKIEKHENLIKLTLKAKKVLSGVRIGDSIAVDGVCLSIVKKSASQVTFDVMRETLLKTTVGLLRKGDKVNCERALKATDRLNGHIVTGHIDQMSIIDDVIEGENYWEYRIRLNRTFQAFIVEKGSVCVDGISLTVGAVKKKYFSVYLIPITRKLTTLGFKTKGDKVNIETDILARYMLKAKG